ncbi:PREDICTED: two-component response regulator-like APRR7 isoform X1 [Erythranthe guttata]|uniref:two-component response regulator-like APRR7 isoform X1 n=2 Tax=Erythranthe guttata TaxID=4155 RepID=UPI00064D7CF7|nr:PREDICTED: two-component response regulator-like APRR7 isoform X1 [Erythranthe guttata]|eukprot:XP_012835975.1 PREDICTED: two-component response regulator-like APRR7 isoform X1 [Erythranthe guttata]
MNTDADGEGDRKGADDGVLVERKTSLQGSDLVKAACWESFLHVRTIRVLLVEEDDSTRHVLAALLRNCNYEVIEAANGLHGWKILEDLTNHVDIVLTEVAMPGFSGIALLCKIMGHETRKNIPVIMMSAHDSMVLVFKCLSKGAADFLVKPIRKNELKNLWQHVWRRFHSSSGSGSGSGAQTQKSKKSKISEKEDNSGSDNGEKNGSNGLNMSAGSDDGSGAQSSWTKQAVEVDSSRSMSPIDQVAQSHAQVIRPNTEISGDKRVDIAVRGGHEQSQPDAIAKGKDLTAALPRNVESNETLFTPISAKLNSSLKLEHKMSIKQIVNVQRNPTEEDKGSSAKVTGIFNINNNATNDSKELNIELSLKRLRGVQYTGGSIQDDRCVLRRSEQSAFSRYNNTSSNVFKTPHGIKGSSITENSVEVAKRESVGDTQARSTDYVVYLSSNGVGNNIDMGSTTNNIASSVNGLCPPTFRPVENDLRYSQPQVSLFLPNEMQTKNVAPKNYHHHQQLSYNQDESSIKKLPEDTPQCGSTNVLGKPMEDNSRNCRNRSASGSNHGSNGHNGTVGRYTESGIGQAGRNGSGDTSGSGGGTGVDECKLAPREAALNKFRQKRKERSFTKRVRYENRKKLAEQRPRVRGQFVKQSGTDDSNRGSNE